MKLTKISLLAIVGLVGALVLVACGGNEEVFVPQPPHQPEVPTQPPHQPEVPPQPPEQPEVPPQPPGEGQAEVHFVIEDIELEPSRAEGNATVEVEVAFVAEASGQVEYLNFEWPVTPDGSAEGVIRGLEPTVTTFRLQLRNASLHGKTDFRGAARLNAGVNEVSLSPLGGLPAGLCDLVTGLFDRIPEVMQTLSEAAFETLKTLAQWGQDAVDQAVQLLSGQQTQEKE